MSLRLRLGLVFAAATALLVAVVGLGFLLQLRVSLDATLDAGLDARVDGLADQYRGGGVTALRLTRDEDPVQLVALDGRVLAASPTAGPGPVLSDAQRRDAFARATDGETALGITRGDDVHRTRFLATPIDAQTLLVVGTGTEIADAADEHVEDGFVVLGPPAVLLAGAGAWWLARSALRPVERMRRQAAAISERDGPTSTAHLAVPGTRDELAKLATTMNDLLDRLRAALEHERGFVADAGHELRTPLATLRAELELAARPGRSADELRTAVDSASEETERLVRLAEDMLLLARAQGVRPFLRIERTDLTTVAASAARAAALVADPRGIDVVVEGPSHVRLDADTDKLRQALDNLLTNAIRHSPDRSMILVSVRAPVDDGPAALSVADQGPGFPPEFLPHAFERFRRADSARARSDGGSGLGLAIVETIATAHGGRAHARNRPDGAEVTIELPVSPVVARSGGRPGEWLRCRDQG